MDIFVNQEAVDIVAALSCIVELEPEGSLDCFVDIGIIKDHGGTVSTKFHRDIFYGTSCSADQCLSHCG